MQRPSLAFLVAALLYALPEVARAADPAPGGPSDPFAPAPEAKEPSVEEQEAAVLGSPAQPAPSAQQPAPPPPTAPVRRPPPTFRGRRGPQLTGEERAADPGAGQTGLAIELSTTSFASGDLAGGVFLGGRSAAIIVGGFLDYGMTSVSSSVGTTPATTQSASALRIGGGLRYTFLQSADRTVDLFGAIDASFEYRGAEIPPPAGTSMPAQTVSASGLSLALGPGLRLWVHENVALGYTARFRTTYLSGETAVATPTPTETTGDASSTDIGFDGSFQILGVF